MDVLLAVEAAQERCKNDLAAIEEIRGEFQRGELTLADFVKEIASHTRVGSAEHLALLTILEKLYDPGSKDYEDIHAFIQSQHVSAIAHTYVPRREI